MTKGMAVLPKLHGIGFDELILQFNEISLKFSFFSLCNSLMPCTILSCSRQIGMPGQLRHGTLSYEGDLAISFL